VPARLRKGAIDLRVSLVVVVALALVAILLAAGCGPQRPPGPPPGEVVLAAGDIASCDTEADEATAELLGANEGTLTLLWDILCPVCRIPSQVIDTLRALREHGVALEAYREALQSDPTLAELERISAAEPEDAALANFVYRIREAGPGGHFVLGSK